MRECSKNALLRSHSLATLSPFLSVWLTERVFCYSLSLALSLSYGVCSVYRRVYRWMQMFCVLRQPTETFRSFFQSIFRHRTLVGAFNFQSSIFCVLFYFCSFIDGHTKKECSSCCIIIINRSSKDSWNEIMSEFSNFSGADEANSRTMYWFFFDISIQSWDFEHNAIAIMEHARTHGLIFKSSNFSFSLFLM